MISMSRAGLLAMIRQGKHGLFLAQKWARPTRIRLRGHVWRGVARVRPYRFDLGGYKDARGFFPFDFFLHRSAPEGWTKDGAIAQRRLWCVWAGDNPMTVNRMHSLDTLKELNPELELTLVTPSNLHRFIVPAHPLHEAYPHLSLPHRSDYLRAYFLHHYGGAYADIKSMGAGMADPVLSVRASDGPWVVGYPEINSDLVDNIHGPLGDDVRHHFHRVVGIGALAARPRTPFTAEWLAEIERRLSYHRADLERHPSTDPFGYEGDYPITWIGLGADVFEPLQLKYLDKIEARPELTPNMEDYR